MASICCLQNKVWLSFFLIIIFLTSFYFSFTLIATVVDDLIIFIFSFVHLILQVRRETALSYAFDLVDFPSMSL